MNTPLRTIVLAIVLSCAGISAADLDVHPPQRHLIPGQTVSYLVTSRVNHNSCVRVFVEEWSVLPDGTEQFRAARDVEVNPSQFYLQAKVNSQVNLYWKGSKDALEVEKPYRISFFQRPIGAGSATAQAGRLSSPSHTTLYVRPHRPKAAIEIVDARIQDGILALCLENRGNTHISIKHPTLLVRFKDGREEAIETPQFIGTANSKDLHARAQRHLFIQLPKNLTQADLSSISLGICSEDNGFCARSDHDLSYH